MNLFAGRSVESGSGGGNIWGGSLMKVLGGSSNSFEYEALNEYGTFRRCRE